MRFLLLGGTGQVGQELAGLAIPDDVEIVAPGRSALDLEDGEAIARVIAAERVSFMAGTFSVELLVCQAGAVTDS